MLTLTVRCPETVPLVVPKLVYLFTPVPEFDSTGTSPRSDGNACSEKYSADGRNAEASRGQGISDDDVEHGRFGEQSPRSVSRRRASPQVSGEEHADLCRRQVGFDLLHHEGFGDGARRRRVRSRNHRGVPEQGRLLRRDAAVLRRQLALGVGEGEDRMRSGRTLVSEVQGTRREAHGTAVRESVARWPNGCARRRRRSATSRSST